MPFCNVKAGFQRVRIIHDNSHFQSSDLVLQDGRGLPEHYHDWTEVHPTSYWKVCPPAGKWNGSRGRPAGHNQQGWRAPGRTKAGRADGWWRPKSGRGRRPPAKWGLAPSASTICRAAERAFSLVRPSGVSTKGASRYKKAFGVFKREPFATTDRVSTDGIEVGGQSFEGSNDCPLGGADVEHDARVLDELWQAA